MPGIGMKTRRRQAAILLLNGLVVLVAGVAGYPAPSEADYIIKDFMFASGETLPALRSHYRVLGHRDRGPKGAVASAFQTY